MYVQGVSACKVTQVMEQLCGPEARGPVLERVAELADRKETVTPAELPMITADALETPAERRFRVLSYHIENGTEGLPHARVRVGFRGREVETD